MKPLDPIKDVHQSFDNMSQEDIDASITASYFLLRGIDHIKTILVGHLLKDNTLSIQINKEEHGIEDKVILKEYKDLLIAYMQCCTECHKLELKHNELRIKKYRSNHG